MLLAIDIGNTNITMGIYNNDELISTYRLTTKFQRTSDEYGFMLLSFLATAKVTVEDIDDIIMSSVVPKVNYSFTSCIKKYLHKNPIMIDSQTQTGIDIQIDNPSALGADRLVDAAGAYYTYGGPCLIVDFGTATTYDVITENKEFIGGATAPGIGICATALSSQAAKLPEIEICKPKCIIGKNTSQSMQAGVVFGYIGLTEYIIKKIKEEYGQDLKVISTGGLGRMITHETEYIDIYDPDLTFKGLKIIYDIITKKQ